MIWNRIDREAMERARLWQPEPKPAAQAGDAQAIGSPLLRAAAAAVQAAFDLPVSTAVQEADLRLAVGTLARRIAGEDAETDAPLPGSPEAHLRIVAALRAEVLRVWEQRVEAPDPAEMIAVLRSFEHQEEVLRRFALAKADATAVPTGSEFIAGVAHDLRSPLTSILFLAETLLSEQSGEVNELQRRQLGIIYSAALGLVSVASDIIELVRGGEGLTERRPILFSVIEIMESVHDIVRPMAEEKGLRVQLFPPAVDQRLGFPLALSRVLLNLTTNGLKFTENGFVEISVRAIGPTRVEFSVRDTGKGYTSDAIDHLYQPFRRSRDGKMYGFSGTGLGLAISRKLVTAMGSELEVESRPGWGTRFYFELELPPGPTT
jgi:signal transduction histidine kinase